MGTQGSSRLEDQRLLVVIFRSTGYLLSDWAEAGVDLQPKIEDVWKLSDLELSSSLSTHGSRI